MQNYSNLGANILLCFVHIEKAKGINENSLGDIYWRPS